MERKTLEIAWRRYRDSAFAGGAASNDELDVAEKHFLAGAATLFLLIDRILLDEQMDLDANGFLAGLFAEVEEIAEALDFQLMDRPPGPLQ